MATGQDVGFLEESSRENPNEAISNLGRGGEPISTESIRASSSPAILELSKDKYRHQDGRPIVPLKKRLSRSCPQQLSETTPLTSNAKSSVGEESEQEHDVDQVEERRCFRCLNFLEWCLDSIMQFRNSKLILVLPIAFALLLLSSIVMGLTHADQCRYLPISGALVGVIGIIFMGLWIAKILCKLRGTPCGDSLKFIICFILLTLVILVVIDMILVFQTSPSFTKGDKNYCHKTFYDYSVWKEVGIVAAFVVSAICYLPRSRSYLCCCNCCSSRPALPNMRYLSIESIE